MPFEHKSSLPDGGYWCLWKIQEKKEALEDMLAPMADEDIRVYHDITHPEKQRQFLAGRLCAAEMANQHGFNYKGVAYNKEGKPYFAGKETLALSISHCDGYAAATILDHGEVGIDIQYPDEKIQKVSERIFSDKEIKAIDGDPVLYTIYWAAKEAMYKKYSLGGLSFKDQLVVSNFRFLMPGGVFQGFIETAEERRTVKLMYKCLDDGLVIVHALPSVFGSMLGVKIY